MKRNFFLMPAFILIFCILQGSLTVAQEKTEASAKADTVAAISDTTKVKEKKDEEKKFDEVVKDFKVIEGLFTMYHKEEDNTVFLEIKPEQMDNIFLCNVTLEAGDGVYFDSGAMWINFPFIFKRVGKKVQFIHKNVYYRADPNTPISRAVSRGVSSSIIGSAKIESKPHPERNSILVDPSGFFLQDYGDIGYYLSEIAKVDFKFDKEESYFSMLKSFPFNTEIETVIHFKNSKPKPSLARIADGRSMQHRYRYSLSTLPETGYRPRLADDRVGHFLTLHQDYTTQTKDSPYVRYVNRWHLEKTNPNAKISKPKQPIVFWLENTIPYEYRQAVKEGALMWNAAFEQIGFKQAIVVKQQPDDADWDPADVRYHTIRWIVMPGGGYAVGPSLANPFTGQIYDADIRISADYIRYMVRGLEEYVDPLSIVSDILNPTLSSWSQPMKACNYGEGKAQEAAFGWSILSSRDSFYLDSPKAKEYIRDAIKDLIAHEVGHTLGLRHNFRASTIHTADELRDKSLTIKEGISGSVMDYNPVNLAGKGKKQGQFWHTSVGIYDYWAIEYAYKQIDAKSPEAELKELKKIASRVSEPKLAYGTDEDAFGFSPQGIDPVTNMFDLGPDPIAFFKERLELATELLNNIENNFEKKGTRYQKMRLVLGQVMRQYFIAAATLPKYVGGIYHRRDHIGDKGQRTPFEPVSSKKQREAMEALKQHIFGREAFKFPPSLMRKLTPERFYDFDFSLYYVPRVDYPIHDVVINLQNSALNRLYHPIRMNRMVDLGLYFENGHSMFSLAEMFLELRNTIWSEVEERASINSFRRNLQRAHLNKIIALVVKPTGAPYFSPASSQKPAGKTMPPGDAIALARADLKLLQEGITKSLNNSALDVTSRAHLEESLSRITAALNAELQRQL
ncbi:zinc-dependent metalloprotease [candidate division KSB1 bacterium]|nr:zinc-dependent metalloprotease [candidate division KSB1 bacterium]